jgi:hypothetical protein
MSEQKKTPGVQEDQESQEEIQVPEGYVLLGKLDNAEMHAIQKLASSEQELTFRIGQYTREILALCSQADETSRRGQEVLTNARKRMDIPLGVPIRMHPGGAIFAQVQQSPPAEEIAQN